MKRRIFIRKTSLTISVIACAPISLGISCTDESENEFPLIQEFLPESDLNDILNSFIDNYEGKSDFSNTSRSDLVLKIADDFLNERTVIYDGWVLSKTEVEHLVFQILKQ